MVIIIIIIIIIIPKSTTGTRRPRGKRRRKRRRTLLRRRRRPCVRVHETRAIIERELGTSAYIKKKKTLLPPLVIFHCTHARPALYHGDVYVYTYVHIIFIIVILYRYYYTFNNGHMYTSYNVYYNARASYRSLLYGWRSVTTPVDDK